MTSPKRIVVVDDDVYTLQLASHCLRPPEFAVFTYGDARDALMKLHEVEPDLIVSDVLMPDMDGRTFFQVVKRSPRLKNVPFIFLSGVRRPEDVVSMLDAGADDFLAKPFPIPSLVAKIRATLRMAERLAQAEPRDDAISGNVGEEGALPLLAFCKDTRLTGRVTVESPFQRLWVDFVGGAVAAARVEPEIDSSPVERVLLGLRGAGYRLDKRGDHDGSYDPGAPVDGDGCLREAVAALLDSRAVRAEPVEERQLAAQPAFDVEFGATLSQEAESPSVAAEVTAQPEPSVAMPDALEAVTAPDPVPVEAGAPALEPVSPPAEADETV